MTAQMSTSRCTTPWQSDEYEGKLDQGSRLPDTAEDPMLLGLLQTWVDTLDACHFRNGVAELDVQIVLQVVVRRGLPDVGIVGHHVAVGFVVDGQAACVRQTCLGRRRRSSCVVSKQLRNCFWLRQAAL